jgi:hypothetical protein
MGVIHWSKWQEALLGDTVVKGRRCSFQCNQYSDWFNINNSDHVVKVSCDTNIGAIIDKAAQLIINHGYLYVEGAITTKTTNAWRGNHMGNCGIRCHRVSIRWVVPAYNEGNTTGWGMYEVVNKRAWKKWNSAGRRGLCWWKRYRCNVRQGLR